MAAELLWHSVSRFDRHTLAILKSYRVDREKLGDAEQEDFERHLIAETARRHATSERHVAAVVDEWIETRPLRHLKQCRYPGVAALFNAVRSSGRTVAVLSDYPARAKLDVMQLAADHILCAGDVGMLKPHPKGLRHLMEVAGAAPSQTVLIGDRADRDGEAARRAGAQCLLRSSRPMPDFPCFTSYYDPLFSEIVAHTQPAAG